ncbi:MAG: cold-shock protein [Euzebya sp.]
MPQGTIKSFDAQTHTGSLVLDDLSELTYDADTFAVSQLLELRIGQRVRFEIEGSSDDRRVTNLQIVSL